MATKNNELLKLARADPEIRRVANASGMPIEEYAQECLKAKDTAGLDRYYCSRATEQVAAREIEITIPELEWR